MSSAACVWIGLGANLGSPIRQLMEARDELAQHLRFLGISSLYCSAPIDCPTPQDDYFNAVLLAETTELPHNLLARLQRIEQSHGRTRESYHASRTLDLDLLLYAALSCSDEILTLPHPAMLDRAFVLHPMYELAPQFRLQNGQTVEEALAFVSWQNIELYVDSCEWKVMPIDCAYI